MTAAAKRRSEAAASLEVVELARPELPLGDRRFFYEKAREAARELCGLGLDETSKLCEAGRLDRKDLERLRGVAEDHALRFEVLRRVLCLELWDGPEPDPRRGKRARQTA